MRSPRSPLIRPALAEAIRERKVRVTLEQARSNKLPIPTRELGLIDDDTGTRRRKAKTGLTDLKSRNKNLALGFHDVWEETPMTSYSVGQGTANEKQSTAQEAALTCSEDPSVDPRRLLGAYYTPDPLPGILTEWALRPGRGTVLDPSYGGCAFMNAATRVLASKGVPEPGRLVFGVDVDRSCLEYVRSNRNLFEKNCIVRDFFALSPSDLHGAPFQAVVGNPPYVRHHWLNGSTRKAARNAIDNAGVPLPARASAWAYFLVHALSFIAKHGRLAMLVPEAIQQADYAASVREALTGRFERVCLVHIRDRLFDHTDEAVVAVAASGYGNPGTLQVEAVEQAQDLATVLNATKGRRSSSRWTTVSGRPVESTVVQLLGELEQHTSVKNTSDIATVRVGLVTGANSHFIRGVEDLKQLGVPRKAWLQVVSRTRWLSGLDFTEHDFQELADAGHRAFLVRPTPAYEDAPGVRRWIAEGIEAGVHERFKCAIRTPWFRIPLLAAPDAFATCTRLGAPLLVLNRAGCHCTNALHAVYWHGIEVSPVTAAVGFLTSAVSVWSELHGRRYGGGVLKMEPGTWNRVPVPLVQGTEGAFDELYKLIRCGREAEARTLADDIVLGDRLGLPRKDIRRLQRAHAQLMAQRQPARDGSDRG